MICQLKRCMLIMLRACESLHRRERVRKIERERGEGEREQGRESECVLEWRLLCLNVQEEWERQEIRPNRKFNYIRLSYNIL